METITWYIWLALGFVLAGLEMLIPGFVLIWFGLSAIIVGGLSFLIPDIAWGVQVGIFSALSGASFFISRRFFHSPAQDDQASHLNDRTRALVGQIVPLTEPIRHGQGKILIASTLWRVKGTDAEPGQMVEIIGAEGDVLLVRLKD